MKILKWALGISICLGLLAIAISVAQQTKNTDGGPKAIGNYKIGNQFGLKGLDWQAEGLVAKTMAIEPEQIYTLPQGVYWADAVAGDTLNAWPCFKVWYDLSGSQPIQLTRPLTFNLATVRDFIRDFDTLAEAGKLGVAVPEQQLDFSDGDSTITRATLFVVTKNKK